MEAREDHTGEGREYFAEALVTCCCFAPVKEFILTKDLDAWCGGCETYCEADEEGRLRDGGVVC